MGGIVIAILIVIGVVVVLSLVAQLGGLIIAVVAWMLAGMFAGRILRGRGYGPVMDVLLGLAGGLLGSVVLGLLRLGWVGDIWIVGNVVVGIVGALLLVWLVRAFGNKDFAR